MSSLKEQINAGVVTGDDLTTLFKKFVPSLYQSDVRRTLLQ